MRYFELVPAILEETVSGMEEKLGRLREIESLERVQVDVVDGLFANKITVVPSDLKGVEFFDFKVDYHLMVDDPMAWVEEVVEAGGERVIAQIERMGSQAAFVDWVKGYEIGVGLAVDLYTPIDALEEDVLEEVEIVLLLGVEAGFGGQEFEGRVLEKIKNLREIYEGEIMVDGGVKKENLGRIIKAGVESVAVGSYLWQGNLKERIKGLYE